MATSTSTASSVVEEEEKEGVEEMTTEPADPDAKPVISRFSVRSDVQFRYARTRVESYVKNPASLAQAVTFSLVIPDRAFVSNFSMLVDGEEFVAEVKEKEKAEETFQEAVDRGAGAGLVQQDTRDANVISVQTNVEPGSKVRFALTYEELLVRKLGRYEQVVHVNPGQIVDDFKVDIFIDESLPVEQVRVPKLKRDPNSITSQDPNPLASVVRDPTDPSKVHVQFVADRADQKEMSEDGVSGQFIVQYDVDGQGGAGDIQLLDGYFVHYFSPDDLDTLPKHVVFVLDVSGSMYGTKLDQTKDAMVTVLDDMSDKDFFNIITFSDDVYHWTPQEEREKEAPHNVTFRGTEKNREEALTYALQLNTIGGTNINDGMVAALNLVKAVKQSEELPANVRPMVIFLTDGEPTTGVVNPDQILANVKAANDDLEVPIYGLAFGHGADFNLIKKLSLSNHAFARRIYEGSDAAIQLEDFYAQIASPLLSNVEFDYVGESVSNRSITKKSFDTFNRGNELVVAGRIEDGGSDEVEVVIKGKGLTGDFERRVIICLRPLPFPDMPEVPVALPKMISDDDVDGGDAAGEEIFKDLAQAPAVRDEEDGGGEVMHVDPSVVTENILPPFPPRRPPFPDRCIPVPPPKPRDPRSEHENFIERLWAFLSIKEYLDEKPTATQERREELLQNVTTTPGPVILEEEEEEEEETVEVLDEETSPEKNATEVIYPPKKTNRQKAIELALQYNFVTPVTSLVVTRPGENETKTVDPMSVSEATSGTGCPCYFSLTTSRKAYSGPQPMMASAPVPRITGGARGGGGVNFRSRPVRPVSRHKVRPTHPPPPPPTSPATYFAMDYAYNYSPMEDNAGDFDYDATPTTTPKTSCSGKVILYSKTYRRGLQVEVDADVEDLAEMGFDNRLKSLEVEGDCCWQIFVDAGHSGDSMLFRSGTYDSASKLISLVNKASSVQRLLQC